MEYLFDATVLGEEEQFTPGPGIELHRDYLTRDGKPWFPISGEFQYSRFPAECWEREIRKMRSCGLNTVASYVFWNHHEYLRDHWVFSGDMDIRRFVTICRDEGMLFFLRIGPWAHGEALYGGFPEYIQTMPGKRSDDPEYMARVEVLFAKLYEQLSDLLYPAGPIFAIQVENEYQGDYSHLLHLKALAEKVGFRVPVWTVTGWPKFIPEGDLLPLYGGYPEAPWLRSVDPKHMGDDYRIKPMECGGPESLTPDPLTGRWYKNTLRGTCELGPGIQVTEMRRPGASTGDAYALAHSFLARGIGWMGYYVFHGGRNPTFAPLNEYKEGYLCNLPPVTYDFQAPLGEYGYAKEKYFALRMLHHFVGTFDGDFAKTRAVFAHTGEKFSASVRIRGRSGYVFVSTYVRRSEDMGVEGFAPVVRTPEDEIRLPSLSLSNGQVFFYPFGLTMGGQVFDYVTAQPLCRYRAEGKEHFCFFAHPEVPVTYRAGGAEGAWDVPNGPVASYGDAVVEVYDLAHAMSMCREGDRVFFSSGLTWAENGRPVTLRTVPEDAALVTLTEMPEKPMPWDRYFNGTVAPKNYRLKVDKALLQAHDDVVIRFDAPCDKAHIYVRDLLLGDYICIDGKFTLPLARYRDALLQGHLNIRTCGADPDVPCLRECTLPPRDASLSVAEVTGIDIVPVDDPE